jgi:hypothetical protein
VRGEMEVGWGCVWKGSEVSRKAELWYVNQRTYMILNIGIV